MSGLSAVPNGPLLNTFSFLLPSGEVRLRSVCKRWNTHILDDPRWKALGEKIQNNSYFPINFSSNQTCFFDIREFCILTQIHFCEKKDPHVIDKLDITFNTMAQIVNQMHVHLEIAFLKGTPDETSSVLEKMMLTKQKPKPLCLDFKLEERIKNTKESLLILKWMAILQEVPKFEQLFQAIKHNHELVMPIFKAIQQFKPDTLTSLDENQLAAIIRQHSQLILLTLKGMKSNGNVIDDERISLAISDYNKNVFDLYAVHRSTIIFPEKDRQYSAKFLSELLNLLKQQKILSSDLMLLQVMQSCSQHVEEILKAMQDRHIHPYVLQKLSKTFPELMKKYNF